MERAEPTSAEPWRGTGECVTALVWGREPAEPLPDGLRPAPGPQLVVAARYDRSPVGPYLELAVAEPARGGRHAGFCVTTMIVDSAASREAGRRRWGFPKELGTLEWSGEGDERVLRWSEADVVVRGVASGPALPALVPFRSVQARADGMVGVWGLMRGPARLSRVEVTAPATGPLAALVGSHRGVSVAKGRLDMRPARTLRD